MVAETRSPAAPTNVTVNSATSTISSTTAGSVANCIFLRPPCYHGYFHHYESGQLYDD